MGQFIENGETLAKTKWGNIDNFMSLYLCSIYFVYSIFIGKIFRDLMDFQLLPIKEPSLATRKSSLIKVIM